MELRGSSKLLTSGSNAVRVLQGIMGRLLDDACRITVLIV